MKDGSANIAILLAIENAEGRKINFKVMVLMCKTFLRDKLWLYLQFHIWVQFTSVINGLGSHSSWALTSMCLSNYDLLDLCSVHKKLPWDSMPLNKLFYFWFLNFLFLFILFPRLEWLHLGYTSANQACNKQVSCTEVSSLARLNNEVHQIN